MQSKNKPAQTTIEREHVQRIKLLPCCVCCRQATTEAPSEAHEIEQGLWWTSIPLCADCHRGNHNGVHGQRRLWLVKGLDEIKALNVVIRWLMHPATIPRGDAP